MPSAARLSDPASHLMTPMSPGAASANVNIGGGKAWRALPAGVGGGIERALGAMKQLMDTPFLNPVTTPIKLTEVFVGLMQDSVQAAGKGSPTAPAETTAGFTRLIATNLQETTTYVTAASVPGGQPAAIAAYTLAMKQAAADFASAAVKAIGAMTDIHHCPQPSGPVPHGPGVVTKGSRSVFINGLPACRQGDKLYEAAGGADPIAMGCLTVNIGDDGGPPAPAPTNAPSAADTRAIAEEIVQTQTALSEPGAPGPVRNLARERSKSPKHRVTFRVVIDQTGVPVSGVSLSITLPDGRSGAYTTDGDGRIEIQNLRVPGACSATGAIEDARLESTLDFVALGEVRASPSEDLYVGAARRQADRLKPGGIIVDIEQHLVESGETLESVAAQAGMTWQQLALFNWNTCNPDEINRHLYKDVGCRRKTHDGRNYVFDSDDDPGVVYIPRQWTRSGLATDQIHTIRVQALAFKPRERRIRLFDGLAQAIPGAPYAVEIDQREVARGLADENGDIILPAAATNVCTVKWSTATDSRHSIQSNDEDRSVEGDPVVPDWEFDFARDIYVDLDDLSSVNKDISEDAARRRLSNMGYNAGHMLSEDVRAFQRDTARDMTGVLSQVLGGVLDHHDERCQPPRGGRIGTLNGE